MNCKILSAFSAGIICASTVQANPLNMNASLPEITAVDQDGKSIVLSNYSKEKWVLLYFFPKADTPGCTAQSCSLRDAYTDLSEEGVKIIGVSKNSVKDQKAFTEKYDLPFTLLADDEARVIKAFGVPQIPVLGLAKRQAYLFKDGILVWKDIHASTAEQAKDVLAQIKGK